MSSQSWRQMARPLFSWGTSSSASVPEAEAAPTTDAGVTGFPNPGSAIPGAGPPPPPVAKTGSHDMRDAAAATAAADDDDDEATTPKAAGVPTTMADAVPTFSLSDDTNNTNNTNNADDADDADDSDNLPPPVFPAPFSAQRTRAAADPSRTAPATPGLMAPPALPGPVRRLRQTLPVPDRGPPGAVSFASGSLSPSASPAKKASRKVALAPGHSPLDWARLTADPVGNRLRGNLPADAPYLLRVPPSQLRRMNGRKGMDAWTALGGTVYNITPYVPFHPGGRGELLRCAGKDGTALFNEVHAWVNYDNMLSACRIGILVDEGAPTTSPMEQMD